MKQIQPKKETVSTSLGCEHCGGAMRLVGSEPHPTRGGLDMLTFACTACDAYLVMPFELPANDLGRGFPQLQA